MERKLIGKNLIKKKRKILNNLYEMVKNIKYLHQISMWLIIIGSLILFFLSFLWYVKGNMIMSFGMMIMGGIALSNFYLHWKRMKKEN